MNFLTNAAARYSFFAREYPFITNSITGFCIATIGDALCQRYFDNNKHQETGKPLQQTWDVRRSLELGLIRATVITPFIHFWYPFLERASPGFTIFRVAGRVLIDQSIGAPITISMVFIAHSVMKGDLAGSMRKLRHQFIDTYTTGLRYWPIVHSINFSVVPLMHRSLFAHCASVYWMAVLSYYSNMDIKHLTAVDEDSETK
jgi:protein Mpv17